MYIQISAVGSIAEIFGNVCRVLDKVEEADMTEELAGKKIIFVLGETYFLLSRYSFALTMNTKALFELNFLKMLRMKQLFTASRIFDCQRETRKML